LLRRTPPEPQLHRRQFSSSSGYFPAVASTQHGHHHHQQQHRSGASCNQHQQRLALTLQSTTRQSSSSSSNNNNSNNNDDGINDILISTEELQSNLLQLSKSMFDSLSQNGYWTNTSPFTNILPPTVIATLRNQAIALRNQGRYEPSYSESVINAITGETVRFDKPGVFACEPDGADYDTAPDMLLYMTILLQTLPPALNSHHQNTMSSGSGSGSGSTQWTNLDNTAFNAKLAVTSSGGSKYPRHVDNVSGIHVGSKDLRKLTAILYLNPSWTSGDGGELRIYLGVPESDRKKIVGEKDYKENKESETSAFVDLSPVGGRLVLFYSDVVPHEVLENAPHATTAADEEKLLDRYALTIWIPASSPVE